MRKRLMIVAGIFALFVIIVVVVSSLTGTHIDRSTARTTGDSFAAALTHGNSNALLLLSSSATSVKDTGTDTLAPAADQGKSLFKGQKPLFVREYISKTYPSEGYTIEEYRLSGSDHKTYTLAVATSQQYDANDRPVDWGVVNYTLNVGTK